jgi:hypothetical protein
VSTASRWLTWTPSQPKIIDASLKTEPAKPSKPSFAGFAGSVSEEQPIIRQELEPSSVSPPTADCPYSLPKGVRLIRYEKRAPRVTITLCSVVEDVAKFIGHALVELDARLHSPVQIRAGDSVFELLSKLADCGLELHLEWPPVNPDRSG